MPDNMSTGDRIVQLNSQMEKLITATKLQTIALEVWPKRAGAQAAATMAATRIGLHGTGLSNDDIAARFKEAFKAMFPEG